MSNERRTKRRFDRDANSSAPPPPVRHHDQENEEIPIPLFARFDDPNTAVKSSECINREIRDAWDDYDSLFYNAWLKVSIETTRFVNPDFHPNPLLLRTPSTMPLRYTLQQAGGPQQEQPEAALPPFPPMPDMSTRPEGDFQRVVVDALTAIWARVSRCRCSSRASVRARSPSAAGPSRQRRGDSEETTDETTDED
ncbi:hypothetical protein DY000_02016118 [Brassica cretica]|uniref:Uncharacterized protein n=1 Tax=Brassica cretica TaxID=69181 RepID=A0ABQ7DA36_BRACR|nr:hypothetical protein DY000_02016118 [Brassica cretica]